MDGKDSLITTLSDKEGLFLKGLLSHHEEERKQAAQQYQQWLQQEFLNTNEENYTLLADRVFRVLQVLFGGRTENEIIAFVELVNVVLSFPKIIGDRLLLLTSLLEEVFSGEITSNMVLPMITTCQHLLNKYHSLFTLFIEHLITISINRLKSSKSTPDILLSLQLLAYVFDICPSFISDDVLLEIPSCVFSWIIGDGNHYNTAFSLLKSIICSLKQQARWKILTQFRNTVLNMFHLVIESLPPLSIESIYDLIRKDPTAFFHNNSISKELLSQYSNSSFLLLARGCLNSILLFSRYCYECIEDVIQSLLTITTRCLFLQEPSLLTLSIYIYATVIPRLKEHDPSLLENLLIPLLASFFSVESIQLKAIVVFSSLYHVIPSLIEPYLPRLLSIIHDILSSNKKDQYYKFALLSLMNILSSSSQLEQFLLTDLENILPLPFDLIQSTCLLKAILLFPDSSEFKDGLFFKFRYCFSPSFIITENRYRLNLVQDYFSDISLRNEEDVISCLFLILSLPISYTGYLPQLLDLVIECIGHTNNKIVLLSLFVIIKYYQYPLTDNQITRLYNILFSLIMTTYDNEVLLLIALAFSLLPHYQLLINENWTFFSSLLTTDNTIILQQLTPILNRLFSIAPSLISISLHSIVFQAVNHYTNYVSVEDAIQSLFIISACFQDCFDIIENDCAVVYQTLLSSLQKTTSRLHRLVLFHTITQLCQSKQKCILDSYSSLLSILSDLINQIDVEAQQNYILSFKEATLEIQQEMISEMTKTGLFLESGIILTFLQSLLQITDCYSILLSQYPNIIHYILFFSTFDYPSFSQDVQQTDLSFLDNITSTIIQILLQKGSFSSHSAINSIFNTITSFNRNLLHNYAISRGSFVYSKNDIKANWYLCLSSQYHLSIYNLSLLSHIASDLLNEMALFDSQTSWKTDYSLVRNSLRISYCKNIEDIKQLKEILLQHPQSTNLTGILQFINKKLCSFCFQAIRKTKVLSEQITLFNEFEQLLLKLPVNEYTIVIEYMHSLAEGLLTKVYHTNLTSHILTFFSTAIQHFSPYLNSSLKCIFQSIIPYWKSNLEEILSFVTSCNTILEFSEAYTFILEQLLYILYDNTFCDNDERVEVLLHLLSNVSSLQIHIRHLLPALQYVILSYPEAASIQFLAISLLKDIVYFLDCEVYTELITSILSSLLTIDNEFLISDCIDIICILASHYSSSFHSSQSITISIYSRFMMSLSQAEKQQQPVKPSKSEYFSDDEEMIGTCSLESISTLPSLPLNRSVVLSNRTILSPSERDVSVIPSSNPIKSFNKGKIEIHKPYLFRSSQKSNLSNSYQFITSLFDQYSILCYQRHYHHTNLALVKKAIASSIPIHIQYEKDQQSFKSVRITDLYSPSSCLSTFPYEEKRIMESIQEITDFSPQSFVRLLIHFIKETTNNNDWEKWISQFRSYFIQFACYSLGVNPSLYERLIPSFSESLFVSCFVYFWFSLTHEQKVLVHEALSSLPSFSISHSIGIIFLSMQMSVVDLDPHSIYDFKEEDFPFSFSYIIHLCYQFHFDDSGVRLMNDGLLNDLFNNTTILPVITDYFYMLNRSFSSSSSSIISLYQQLQESYSIEIEDISTIPNTIENCMMSMGEWKDIHSFVDQKLQQSTCPTTQLQVKKGIIKVLFQLDQFDDVLSLCQDCQGDEDCYSYQICTEFSLCQFQSVYQQLQEHPISYHIDLHDTNPSSLKKSYYCTLATLLTLLCNHETMKALQLIQDIQSVYYSQYIYQLKHYKTENIPSQLFLFFFHELNQYIRGNNPSKQSVFSNSRMNSIILQNKNNSSIWKDIFVFRKFIQFLYPSIKQNDQLPTISSHLQIEPYLGNLKQIIQKYPDNQQASLSFRQYQYTYGHLLYCNNHQEEAIHYMSELKAIVIQELASQSLSIVEELQYQELIVRCSNRLLKWNASGITKQSLQTIYQDVLQLPQLAINYKIYWTLNLLFSKYMNDPSVYSQSVFLHDFFVVVTNCLMLIPSSRSLQQLNLLHHFLLILNRSNNSFETVFDSVSFQIPLHSYKPVLNVIIQYCKQAEKKWGMEASQTNLYRKLMKLLVYNEDYIPSIIIQLEDEQIWMYKEISSYLIGKQSILLRDVLQLKQELVKLSTNKLSRILSLKVTEDSEYLNALSSILDSSNECELDSFITQQIQPLVEEKSIQQIQLRLQFLLKQEGSLLSNYSSFLSSQFHSSMNLNLTVNSTGLKFFDKKLVLKPSILRPEVCILLTEVMENNQSHFLQLVHIQDLQFSCEVLRLFIIFTSLFSQKPIVVDNLILPLTSSLCLAIYNPSLKSVQEIINETASFLPESHQESLFRLALWRLCHSSEEWANYSISFSTSVFQRSFETSFLSMGVIDANSCLIDISRFSIVHAMINRVFSCLDGDCRLLIDSSAKQIMSIIHKKEKKRFLVEIIQQYRGILEDMILCEIGVCKDESEISCILNSLSHRIEDIKKDSWEGLVYL